MTAFVVATMIALGISGVNGALLQQPERVFGYDPVVLVETGQKVEGKANVSQKRLGFTYLFSSQETRTKFLRKPEKYEFQFGGSCARMGPLSGIGNPNHFAVMDGKLYAFASASCKKTFEANSDKLLERDDPKPNPTLKERQLGKLLAERMLRAHGGNEACKKIPAFECFYTGDRIESGRTYRFDSRFAFNLPKRQYAESEGWDGSHFGSIVSDKEGWFSSGHTYSLDMHPDQAKALRKREAQQFAGILWNLASKKGICFAPDGSTDTLAVWIDGTLSQLTIGVDGTATSQQYMGRDSRLFLAPTMRQFTEWQRFQGVLIPIRWRDKTGEDTEVESFRFSVAPLTDLATFFKGKAKL